MNKKTCRSCIKLFDIDSFTTKETWICKNCESKTTIKTCKTCKKELSFDKFTKGKTDCRECRNNEYQDKALKEFIAERTPLRNEFFRECLNGGWTIEQFQKKFIPYEKHREMLNEPDKWHFTRCKELLEDYKKFHVEDFDRKFLLDGMFYDKKFDKQRSGWIFII